jgi:hypothetical protein
MESYRTHFENQYSSPDGNGVEFELPASVNRSQAPLIFDVEGHQSHKIYVDRQGSWPIQDFGGPVARVRWSSGVGRVVLSRTGQV